jgi:hypothetical protein
MIEVNGEQYIQREIKPMGRYPKIYQLLALSAMMGGYGGPREPERPKVNIVEEYELVLKKQSKLSRSQREWVVRQFNKNFIKVNPLT